MFKTNTMIMWSVMMNTLLSKEQASNIGIADPEKISDTVFSSTLLIDTYDHDMARLTDTAITDVARQMIIAVTKKFLISAQQKESIAFVTHRIDSEFLNFLFPMPALIQLEIKNYRQRDCNIKATVEVFFYQHDDMAACIYVEYASLKQSCLQRKELHLAKMMHKNMRSITSIRH